MKTSFFYFTSLLGITLLTQGTLLAEQVAAPATTATQNTVVPTAPAAVVPAIPAPAAVVPTIPAPTAIMPAAPATTMPTATPAPTAVTPAVPAPTMPTATPAPTTNVAADNATYAKTKESEEIRAALTLTPDPVKGKEIYETCALCHTPEGWGSPDGRFPQIAGQHASVLIKQLADIRAGNRDNPTMYPFATSAFKNGPQGIADIAAYIEKLPMVPNNGVGPGIELAHGEKLYKDNCAKCHGDSGEGDAKEFHPRIHGQHFNYILRQLHWIQLGKRRNADPKMTEQLKSFNGRDIIAVADYVSRLKPDSALVAEKSDWRNPDFNQQFLSAPKVQEALNQPSKQD